MLHLHKRIKHKVVILQLIHKKLMDLADTIRAFQSFVDSQWMEFKQTGSIGSKKAAMLAEIENDKHKMSFEFLVGLKQLIKDSLENQVELAKEYLEYA